MVIKINNMDKKILKRLNSEIFIYPTDTIYGIGCNAENEKLVKKIREIKNRDKKPFSIIAPNIEFILKNCETTKKEIKKYLPGPYTLILKKKYPGFLDSISENEFIGIRIPDHEFTKILQKTGKPIVTTSVNLSGEKPANKIEEINENILGKVDLIINAGELSGKAYTIVKGSELIER